jgi:ATP-dependent helicase/nuclease subunit A
MVNLIKEKKVKPQQIIMTTFTEKAADELREKAREVLYEEGLFEDANLFDQAMIGTVHSVGNSFVAKYWYRLGLNAKLSVMSEEDRDFYINQSLADLAKKDDIDAFRHFTDEFNIQCSSEFGNSFVPDYNFWKTMLYKIIDKALINQITDLSSSKEESRKLVNITFRPVDNSIEIDEDECCDMAKYLYGIAEGLNDTTRMDFLRPYMRLKEWNIYKINSFVKWLRDLPKRNYLNKYPKINVFATKYDQIWHSDRVVQLLYNFIDRSFSLAENWLKVYSEFKRSKSIIDYNDMEQYFLSLLNDGDIIDDIRGRYKYVFVDEFQDCNPIQVKIFDKLSEYVTGSYWVGDAKQAIYGFRGTDTKLTSAVADTISEDKNNFEKLASNYRSTPDIVEVVNKFFSSVFVQHFGMMTNDQVELKPENPSNGQPQLLAWKVNGGNLKQMNQAVADKVEHLITDEGEKPETIAILCYDKNNCISIAKSLKSKGLPVNYGVGEKLAEQKETILLTSILSLIIDEHDELAKAQIAFLTTPDMPIEMLIDSKLKYISDKQEKLWLDDNLFINSVIQKRKDLSVLSVAAMVESVIITFNLYAMVTRWGNKEVRWSNLKNIIAQSRQYEEHCSTMTIGTSVTGFISYLSSSEFTSVGDTAGVFVNTYHSSKGLEWKTVILLSLDRKVGDKNDFLKKNYFGVRLVDSESPSKENLYPKKNISLMPFVFGIGNTNAPSAIYDAVSEMPNFQDLMNHYIREEARLMYVGMTRAKERLVLVSKNNSNFAWLKEISGSEVTIPTTEGNVDILGTGIPFQVEVLDTPADDASQQEDSETCKIVDLPCSSSAPEATLRYQSPSTMAKTSTEVSLKHDFGSRINLHGEDDIQKVGDCIHNIFCVLVPADKDRNMEKARSLVASYGLQDRLSPEEVLSAYDAFLLKMREFYGEASKIYHELEFAYPEEGSIVRGSMDFVYETPKGCVLVDFKSNPMGHSVFDKTSEHYAGNYNTQFCCYAAALNKAGKAVIERLVYYPVNGFLVSLKQ